MNFCSLKPPSPHEGGKLSRMQGVGLAVLAVLAILAILLLVGCQVPEDCRTVPVNTPEMRFIYNTHELAVRHGLPSDKCGVENQAFKEYVFRYALKHYSFTEIRFIYGRVLGGTIACIRYAVIYLE